MNATQGFARASKRHNLYARDYIENVFRCAPRNAVAVFHKDVQLFSLWAAQLVDGRRPDLSLVSDGLSGSPWYWEMKRRWKTAASPEISLKEPGGWQRLKSSIGERALVAGTDVELTDRSGLDVGPLGLLMQIDGAGSPTLLRDLCLYRGRYVYGGTADFFSTDLIGDHARAHHQQGFDFMARQEPALADWFLRRSESLDPTFSRATSDRGYIAYTQGNVGKAYALYETAARKADRTIALAAQYKSLPEVASGVRAEASMINTQWGAMAERLGRLEEGRALYLRALGIQENAQAHYNLAVTYWGKDWAQVIAHMRRALELNPQMQDARVYLGKAQAMVGK